MGNLLTSREFWSGMVGLFIVLAGAFVPGYKLDMAGAISALIIICSYLYGVTVDPGPGGWRGWIQSRKFWGAIIGLAIIILDGFGLVLPAGLTPEMLITLAGLIGALIVTWAKQPLPEPAPVLPEKQ